VWQLKDEKVYITLDGFLMFVVGKVKEDVRRVWLALFTCGYDLHLDRFAPRHLIIVEECIEGEKS